MTSTAQFPALIRQNGRLYGERGALENYKRVLAGMPPLNLDPNRPVELVPAKQIAAELGFGRRTLGRRIAVNVKADASAQNGVEP
jgi:hypothetical protein